MLNKLIILFSIIGILTISIMLTIVSAQTPVLHQDFDGDTLDRSSYNHVTYGTYVTYVNALFDKGAYFNGAQTYVRVSDDPILTFSSGGVDKNMSMEFLIQPEDDNTKKGLLCKGYNPAGTYEYITFIRETGEVYIRYKDYTNGGTLTIETDDSIFTKTSIQGYYHVFIVKPDNNNIDEIEVYINAVKQDVTRSSAGTYTCMTDTTQYIYEGYYYSSGVYRYKGIIDDIKLYDEYFTHDMVNYSFNALDVQHFSIQLQTYSYNKNNVSLYKNNVYVNTYEYNENIIVENNNKYTIVMNENNLDKFEDINNINNIAEKNISSLIYIIIVFMIVGLIIYFIRR